MNEKIKEFIKESDLEECIDDSYLMRDDLQPFIEKFAELIVRECGKIIVNGGYRNPAFGEKHPLTPPEIATMIREYFGEEK